MKLPIEKIESEKNIFKYFQDIVEIANHYNINQDFFDQAFFRPALDLTVKYKDERVFYGNKFSANKVINLTIIKKR